MQTSSTKNIVGVFDDYESANRAVEALRSSGFSSGEIEITSAQNYAGDTALGNTGLSGQSPHDASGGGIGGFFRRLFGADIGEEERSAYSEAVRRGSTVVCVSTDDAHQDEAVSILDQNGAIDIDRRVASWKQQGYQNYDPSAAPYSQDEILRERQQYADDRTIPVVQEELQVGKRTVNRGAVRVFNRITEQPVEENVNLREEHVRVDRRPTDRAATEEDIRRHDEVIEVSEMGEEPVVQKRTRVVEEVIVGKESTEHTETVRDTVRRSDVQVERTGTTDRIDYDQDYRADFKTRFGSDRSARYETYAPAYQYGSRVASDPRYKGRSWNDVESTLRTDYERNNPNSKWEQAKDAVRYGWEKMTGRH